MRWFALLLTTVALLAGCGGSSSPAKQEPAAAVESPPCSPPTVHHSTYPGLGTGLDKIPWIAGAPADTGLVGVLAYWPPAWRHVRVARVYTGGVAPGGLNMKVMWAFLAPRAKRLAGTELVVRAQRMDGPGRWRDTFAAIGYEDQHGVPSYASIIALPRSGCWRLTLTTGKLTASVDMLAVRG